MKVFYELQVDSLIEQLKQEQEYRSKAEISSKRNDQGILLAQHMSSGLALFLLQHLDCIFSCFDRQNLKSLFIVTLLQPALSILLTFVFLHILELLDLRTKEKVI